MPTKSILEVAPFQLWLFLIASVLNLALGYFGVVGATIQGAIRILSIEAKTAGEDNVHAEMDAAAKRKPLGKVVGFLEGELYLYAMFTQVHAFIGAVLLFKAFSGWLVTHASDASPEVQSTKTLTRFYCYAIGNFTSLIWALIVFEGLRWAVRVCSAFKNIVWMT